MSQTLCACPSPAGVSVITDQTCGFDLRQITKLAFGTTGNPFTASGTAPLTDIDLVAAWTARIALTDGADPTGIAMTPKISNYDMPNNESIDVGGNDNSTPDGVTLFIDGTSITVSGMFRDLDPTIAEELRQASCAANFGVMMLTRRSIVSRSLDFIPVAGTLFVGSIGGGSKVDTNLTSFKFVLNSDWDANLQQDNAIDFVPSDLLNA